VWSWQCTASWVLAEAGSLAAAELQSSVNAALAFAGAAVSLLCSVNDAVNVLPCATWSYLNG
jgi:hypothetical protein